MAISFNFISTSMSDTTRLPYLAWLPFDWKCNSTAYAWLYTYQVIGVIIQANINVSLDLLMAYSMHVASIKFELLGDRLQRLSEMKKDGGGKPRQQTRDLIRGHLQLSSLPANNTSPVENFVFFTSLSNYQLCMICQVFVPCYFGNEIILKHESITGSIFKCGWDFRDIHFRRVVIIFMEIVTKERHILVGNWKVLDLNLFVSIMNFAYRLYTVLV
ncbi:odorant receptor 94b-like [Bradysia coprophila]|uniref:odorant receptor 94b-like n=1 Tax=Bradysia coprophila TaxID=38358 RepID=UPI00187D813A|nr:odorant receptor 94b-like [Bradysia coprophila]